MEIDDDVFFADLSKQIALLLMDDDGNNEEEEEEELPAKQRPLLLPVQCQQGFAYVPRQTFMPPPPPPLAYDQLACRRESKGTGVFIPRSCLPRRKNRSGRAAPISTSSSRQPDRGGVAVPRLADTNCRYSDNSYHSALPKRHP